MQRATCVLLGGIFLTLPIPFCIFGVAFILAGMLGPSGLRSRDDWRANYRPG